MRRLLSAILALYLAAGVLPVQILAEETEDPIEEQSEVIEEAEEVTEEETEEVIEEELPEETEAPAEETEITEEPVIEEVIPETEEPVIEEAVPETEEPVIEETEAPEPVTEVIIPETEEPVIEEVIPETAEPEEVIEEEVTQQTEEPVIEEAVEEPVQEEPAEIIEEITEENDLPEAPATLNVVLDANGGRLDKEITGVASEVEIYSESVPEYSDYYIYGNSYYERHVTRSGYRFCGWYRDKKCTDGKEVPEYTYVEIVSDFHLYAKWEPGWKVTFKANGGEFYDGNTASVMFIAKGDKLSYCSDGDPEKSGKIFDGWSLKKNDRNTVIDLDEYTLKSDITLYAYWKDSVTVIFRANGGKFSDGTDIIYQTYPKDEICDFSYTNIPEKSGYVFSGWYTDSSLSEAYKAGISYQVKKNITLYAKYAKYYTVKFDGNGKNLLCLYKDGTYLENKSSISVKVEKGTRVYDNISYPHSNSSEYYLEGWYTDKACSLDKKIESFSYIPSGDTTLYAKWAKLCAVKFYGNGGTSMNGGSSVVLYTTQGSGVPEEPQFTHPSKAFGGWYLDSALTKRVLHPAGYAVTKNLTFYAKWISGVKVTFDAVGGKFDSGKSSLDLYTKKGCRLALYVPYPEKDGYVFTGWYKDKAYTQKVEDPYFLEVSKETKLYAKWVQSVKVVFDAGEGWFGVYNEETSTYETKHKISAYFGKDSMMYHVYVYPEHNVYGAAGDGDYDYMQTPYRTEKYLEFEGWYTDKALTKKFDFSKSPITKSMTVYAKYKESAAQEYVTVTIDPNGGKISKNGSAKVSIPKGSYFYSGNTSIDPPAGKNLYGFTTVKNDPSTLIGSSSINKNIKVYAYYLPVYTVILNANGGFIMQGSYASGYVYFCEEQKKYTVFENEGISEITLCTGDDSDCVMTNKEGMIFRGWYSDKACTKFVTYDVRKYKFKKNMTLYAKWGAPTAYGWKKSNGKWWYKLPNGYYYADTFAEISGKEYYFDSAGYMVTGWQKISGRWYWFESSGAMVTGWKKLNNKWYYFDEIGAMVTGWQKISGKWYYFLSGGAMVTGWKKISGKWYYFLSGGAMVTGWKKINGVWYWFESSGAMKTGWKKISGKWYYFDSSGAMVTGTRTIGGKTYNFDSNGVCLNP